MTDKHENIQFETEDGIDNSTRKLAVVTRIKSIAPIPEADRVVAVTFTANSWVCVAAKDEYQVGDPCVFWEIDSFLPKDERYDGILAKCLKTMRGQEGYRLRSQRFRGQISQGFSMPLSKFPELYHNAEDGTDVTAILGVRVYQKPATGKLGFNIGSPLGDFPTHLCRKTDQLRIQSMGTEVLGLFDHKFEVTEKLDGSSCTMILHRRETPASDCSVNPCICETTDPEPILEGEFYVCSRNLVLKPPGKEIVHCSRPLQEDEMPVETGCDSDIFWQKPDGTWMRKESVETEVKSVYWNMAHRYNVEERLMRWCKEHDGSIAIQGEIVGFGIQKNPLGLNDVQFFVFDIFDIRRQRYFPASARHTVIDELNSYDVEGDKIQHVPVLGYQTITPGNNHIVEATETMSEHTRSYLAKYGNTDDCPSWSIFVGAVVDRVVNDLVKQAEGTTFTGAKHREGLVFKSVANPSISFKVINNQFLLAEKD